MVSVHLQNIFRSSLQKCLPCPTENKSLYISIPDIISFAQDSRDLMVSDQYNGKYRPHRALDYSNAAFMQVSEHSAIVPENRFYGGNTLNTSNLSQDSGISIGRDSGSPMFSMVLSKNAQEHLQPDGDSDLKRVTVRGLQFYQNPMRNE